MAMAVTYAVQDGMILWETRSGVTTVYVPDHNGNVVECRDNSGNQTYSCEYWPYGEVQTSTGTNPSKLGFGGIVGYVTDSVSRLYVRARHYAPARASWLTVDPLWPMEAAYGYVKKLPVSKLDPTGFGPTAIPFPPPGISEAAWQEVVAMLVALGMSLEVIVALLILVIELIYLGCQMLRDSKRHVCPDPHSPQLGLSGCTANDGCLVQAIKAKAWEVCAATQIAIDLVCFGGMRHGTATEDRVKAFRRCYFFALVECFSYVVKGLLKIKPANTSTLRNTTCDKSHT